MIFDHVGIVPRDNYLFSGFGFLIKYTHRCFHSIDSELTVSGAQKELFAPLNKFQLRNRWEIIDRINSGCTLN